MAFTFKWDLLPSRALRHAVSQLLSITTGHDHDGVNSRLTREKVTVYAADGAIAISQGVARLTKGSAGAYTLAAPATADDGIVLHIVAGTDYAHVVAIATTSLLDGTNTPKGKCTTAAYIGSGITIVAINGKWLLRANVAATIAAS